VVGAKARSQPALRSMWPSWSGKSLNWSRPDLCVALTAQLPPIAEHLSADGIALELGGATGDAWRQASLLVSTRRGGHGVQALRLFVGRPWPRTPPLECALRTHALRPARWSNARHVSGGLPHASSGPH